jgi:hypothetical protein
MGLGPPSAARTDRTEWFGKVLHLRMAPQDRQVGQAGDERPHLVPAARVVHVLALYRHGGPTYC